MTGVILSDPGRGTGPDRVRLVDSEVIVIGAGVIGLSAAFELARDGRRVTVVSADIPGSQRSAGRSRIFRLAHADAFLTEAAAESRQLWAEWERLAGRPLLDPCGLLLTGEMTDREIHLRRFGGLEHGTGARHPLAVPLEEWSLEPTGAATRAEETVRFLQTGFDLVLAEVIEVDAGGLTLSDGSRLEAERVVVCAGPDTYRLLGLPEPPRLRSVRFSFALRDPLESPAPCWINRDDRVGEPFYAVMDGPDHYSIGLSGGAAAAMPEDDQVRDTHRRVLDIVRRVFPGLHPVAERVIACEFTANPAGGTPAQAHDGWDLSERDGVLGLTGPSLFKFAPLLGRLVADRIGATGRPLRSSSA